MSLIKNSTYQPKTLRDQVVEQIRNMIYEGEIEPGSLLREQEFTKRLGISRTPLREAFILLERDGLVETQPNRSLKVREFNETDIQEIFDMRTALENFAAALLLPKFTAQHIATIEYMIEQQRIAIEHNNCQGLAPLDWAFHYYLVSCAGNSRLEGFWHTLSLQYQAVIVYKIHAFPDYDDKQMIRDHTAILDAYKSGELDKIHTMNAEINQMVADHCIIAWRQQHAVE